MRTIEVKNDQTLLDIALQEYGHIEGVFLLIDDNPSLLGICDTLLPGDKLLVRETALNRTMQQYLASFPIQTAKGVQGEGIGYWSIEASFTVT